MDPKQREPQTACSEDPKTAIWKKDWKLKEPGLLEQAGLLEECRPFNLQHKLPVVLLSRKNPYSLMLLIGENHYPKMSAGPGLAGAKHPEPLDGYFGTSFIGAFSCKISKLGILLSASDDLQWPTGSHSCYPPRVGNTYLDRTEP